MCFKLKKCCFCVPLNIGIYLIGFLSLASLITSSALGSLWPCIFDAITLFALTLMLVRNNPQTRALFFAVYCIQVLLMGFMRTKHTLKDPKESTMITNFCSDIELKLVYAGNHNTGWAITEYRNFQDCITKVGERVWHDESIMLMCVLSVQIYFCIVIASYLQYKPHFEIK